MNRLRKTKVGDVRLGYTNQPSHNQSSIQSMVRVVAFISLTLLVACSNAPVERRVQLFDKIKDGTVPVNPHGQVFLSSDSKALSNDGTAYATRGGDGSLTVLFIDWQGKSSNLQGQVVTDGPVRRPGDDLRLLTFVPLGPNGGVPVGYSDVTVIKVVRTNVFDVARRLD